jgi:hypothetical protein
MSGGDLGIWEYIVPLGLAICMLCFGLCFGIYVVLQS